MTKEDQVAAHYASASLVEAIKRGIQQLGKTTQTATIADLAPVDEFHIGGRQATMDFMDQLSLRDTDSVLDIGCGIGGAARFVADHYGAKVTGIDLTKEFVETGEEICRWLGLDDRVSLQQGSALNLPFEPSSFHHAYMMHVGMNIADKGSLARQIARVVKPGGTFGVFDVMRTGDEELLYPVPWATIADTSVMETADDYSDYLKAAGFTIVGVRNRKDIALDFYKKLRATAVASNQVPPLGLHILMGQSAPTKVKNMLENVSRGRIAPVEILAKKP